MTDVADPAASGHPAAQEKQSLEKVVSHLLEECRMVLPGIQAMLGFQLIAVFNNGFSEKLTQEEQYAHLASVGLMILSIASLLAPAAYHRIVETETISEGFVTLASCLLGVGMFFLMSGLCVDFYLIARLILHGRFAAAMVTIVAGAVLGVMWFVFPVVKRLQRR